MDAITPYQAVKRMKELTELGSTFSFSFMSYSTKKKESDGIVIIERAILRKGYRDDQSDLSHQLIGYIDMHNADKNRFFHLPLLLSFNNYKVKP